MSDLIRLTWIDSHSPNMQGWIKEDEIDHDILEIETVGFILHECKKSITLANQMTQGGEVAGVISIPKVCILKRKKLK